MEQMLRNASTKITHFTRLSFVITKNIHTQIMIKYLNDPLTFR